MKKQLIVLALLLVAAVAWGQTVHEVVLGDPVTIEWDAAYGPAEVSYDVWLDDGVLQTWQESVFVGTEFTYVLPALGDYVAGVQTRWTEDGINTFSDINWSNVNGASTPDPFIFRVIELPPETPVAPVNLRIR